VQASINTGKEKKRLHNRCSFVLVICETNRIQIERELKMKTTNGGRKEVAKGKRTRADCFLGTTTHKQKGSMGLPTLCGVSVDLNGELADWNHPAKRHFR
jgi:hypothetical protein